MSSAQQPAGGKHPDGTETRGRMERWEKGWGSGRYSEPGQAFHQAEVHSILEKNFEHLKLSPGVGQRVLVPLCGKTVDMVYIADQNVHALGLEGVRRPIEEFQELIEVAKLPSSDRVVHASAQHHWRRASGGVVGIVEGDALSFEVDDKGHVDAVWDRAALVALSPADREPYVEMLSRVVKPGGRVLLTVVQHDIRKPEDDTPYGPPYSISEELIQELYGQSQFTILQELGKQDLLPNEPRWQSKGATFFHEASYLLEKGA